MPKMRHFFLALFCALPVQAIGWTFTPDPICTLRHTAPESGIVITYDPATALYDLTVTLRSQIWEPSASFGMAFTGGAGLTIGTSQHRTDGPRLSVSDRGFGNVLNGLEYNAQATAFTETQSAVFSLRGAAEPVRAFRSCTQAPPPSV